MLIKEEHAKLEKLINVLKPFNKVSETLSGESYVTSSMVIPGFKHIEKSYK